jgi:type I restriction enzyme, S subunit
MKIETFFERFDQLADASNEVAKMRELVLDLAVKGKLVPQDPNDEPASELLNKLKEFKSSNQLNGRSGRAKDTFSEIDSETSELPPNWARTTIGEILHVIRGASPRPKGDPLYFSETRTPYHWVKISDIRKHGRDGLLMDTDEFLTEAGMRKSVLLPKGTLVLTNSATIGVPIVLGIEGCCIHDGYLAFPKFPDGLLSQKFFLYSLHTLKKHAEKSARGLAQLNLNTDLVRSFPFGLPPLAEQKRIVAKADELMALCDRLEQQQQERDTRHAALARASLARFADAPTPANLNFLFYDSYTIEPADLRKTILTLAVQGELVPQDPNDEPAVATLSACGVDLSKSAVGKGEQRHLVPESWVWARFAAVGDQRLGKMLDKQKNKGTLRPYLRNTNVQWMRFELDDVKQMRIEDSEEDELRLRNGDLLICEGGEPGRCAIWKEKTADMYFQKALHRVRSCSAILSEYLALNLRLDCQNNVLAGYSTGATIKHLTGRSLSQYPVPLPPLGEQRRIVAKVNQLMALVDQLEAQLAASRATATSLMNAIVAELTVEA